MLFSGWGLIDSTIMNTRPRSCRELPELRGLGKQGKFEQLIRQSATAPILPHDRRV